MAGNWGAILAGLAGGAGSLAQSMDKNEQRAEERRRQAIAEAIQMLAVKDTYGLTELPDGQSDKDALTLGAVEQLSQTKPNVQAASIGGPFDTSYKSGPSISEQRAPQIEHGPQRVESIGARRYLADPSQGKEARAERRGEESAERKAEADWKRLQASLTGQEKIANLRAKAAADQAAAALAGRFQMQDKGITAAQTRAETMADAQRGMIGGVTQTMEGDTPMVTAYTRGGGTRQLGQAVPKAAGATKEETKLAAGEAERSYMNLLDPRTQKIADPPGWVDRKASQSDVGNVIASDAGGAYMTNVRGLIRAWVVTVEGKRMSDADARVNEMLKSFRFGGGKIADEQTKRRLEGMYRDILKMAGRGPSSPSAPTTAPAPPTSGDRTTKYRSPNG